MNHKRKRLNGYGYSSGGRFVQLEYWTLRSNAWERLSLPGRCLFIELLQRYNGSNNGEISFSNREAVRKLGVGKNTATKLFRELEDFGFITASQRGSFDWKVRHATNWEITNFDRNGRPATRDFMRVGRDEIQNPLPQAGAVSPAQRDRTAQTLTASATYGPSTWDRQTGASSFDGPSAGGTPNIPGRGADAASASITAIHAGPTLSQSRAQAFGCAVRSGREERHWSQAQLARKVGVSRSHVANIEGGRFGSEEVRARIAQKLGLRSGAADARATG